MNILKAFLFFTIIFLLVGQASAKVISFEEQYQDYLGNWHKYNEANILFYPMYFQSADALNRTFSTMGNTIIIPKIMDVTLSDRRISPSMTFPKTQLASRMINYNATVAYLVFPYSLSRLKDWGDEHNIRLGRWHFDTTITISDSNGTIFDPTFYDFKIVNGEIRLYFNKGEADKLEGSITFQMNSWTIDNATTAGFTTSNISLNGSSWTGQNNGGLRLNYLNNSSLNMTGLVAAWNFDEQSGTIAHNVMNESGLVNLTNQGTLNNFNLGLNNCTGNCSGWNSSGVIGNALAFDGVNDYVDAGNASTLNIANAITIEEWIRNSGSNTGTIFHVGKIGDNTHRVYGVGTVSGKPFMWLSPDGTQTNRWYRPSTRNLSTDLTNWHHIVGTFSASSGTHIYVDGILTDDVITGTEGSSIGATTSHLTIGSATGAQYFNGTIDEVRIYNRALSASEISVMYNTSLRTQAMPLILNQTASAGNVINRTRIVYSGQDSINNASIYARQNGTTTWSLIQSNATSNTWYSITNQFNSMDFGVQLNGNGSNTPFFTSLEWDEGITYISDTPTNLQNTTGNFWVRHSWQGTSQSYNVSVNGTWYNGTTNLFFNNSGLTPHNWSNISVAGFNSSGGLSNLSSFVSMNTQIPNNIPVTPIIHTTYLVNTGATLNFTINSTDIDGDTLTYSSNNTIGTFDISTGNFSYTGNDLDAGNYTIYFTVNDGYGGIVTQITTITEQSITQMLLALIQDLPTKDDVSNAGALGFIGGIMGGMIVISIIKRNRKN